MLWSTIGYVSIESLWAAEGNPGRSASGTGKGRSLRQAIRATSVILASVLVFVSCAGGTPAAAPGPADTGAPASCPDANAPIKIGIFQALTGANAFIGVPAVDAIKMRLDEVNAAGGVNGRQLELDIQDERGDPKEGANLAQRFTSDPSFIAGLGGSTSTVALAAAPIFTAAKVVLVCATCSHPDVTKNSTYVYRTVNQQAQLAEPYAHFLAERLKAKRIAFLVAADEFSRSNAEQTAAALKAKYPSVQIVLNESVTTDTRDFRPLITKLQSVNPDMVYMILFPAEGAAFVKQVRQSGQKWILDGGPNFNTPVFLELAGDAAEGVYARSFFDPSDQTAKAKEFIAKYQARYNKIPDHWSAFADDAFMVLVSAIRSASTGKCLTRQGVADAFATLPTYDGLTGVKKYITGTGDIEAAAPHALVVENGKFRVLGPNEP